MLKPLSYAGIGFVMTQCLMAYNGWSYVSFVAGEIKDPGRNLPRALALGMCAVMALYVVANIAYFNVMTVPEIAASERVGADVALRTMGPAGATLISAVVLLSIAGAVNGCILTSARIPFAQARDGMFFSVFGRIHPRFVTPAFAIVVVSLWSGVLILTGTYETLSSYTVRNPSQNPTPQAMNRMESLLGTLCPRLITSVSSGILQRSILSTNCCSMARRLLFKRQKASTRILRLHFVKSRYPLVVVAEKERADYALEGVSDHTKAGWAKVVSRTNSFR